jgi:hypothetical protein
MEKVVLIWCSSPENGNEADNVLTNAAIQTMYVILNALFKRTEGAYVGS